MTPREVFYALSTLSGSYSEEGALRDAIAGVLGDAAVREAVVGPRERIDFLVGKMGIEVKVKGSRSEVTRQLFRYAECEGIDEILLVTTKMQHSLRMPSSMLGKPVAVIVLWGAML